MSITKWQASIKPGADPIRRAIDRWVASESPAVVAHFRGAAFQRITGTRLALDGSESAPSPGDFFRQENGAVYVPDLLPHELAIFRAIGRCDERAQATFAREIGLSVEELQWLVSAVSNSGARVAPPP